MGRLIGLVIDFYTYTEGYVVTMYIEIYIRNIYVHGLRRLRVVRNGQCTRTNALNIRLILPEAAILLYQAVNQHCFTVPGHARPRLQSQRF